MNSSRSLYSYAKNLSQNIKKEFAKMLDVTPAQVTKLLSGKENLGLKTISKIESVLQMDLVSIPNYEHYYTMQSAMGAMYVNEE